jgi:uncharacterized protein YjbI with pentapeptide repeats
MRIIWNVIVVHLFLAAGLFIIVLGAVIWSHAFGPGELPAATRGAEAATAVKDFSTQRAQLILTSLGLMLAAPFFIWHYSLTHVGTETARQTHLTGLFSRAVDRLGSSRDIERTIPAGAKGDAESVADDTSDTKHKGSISKETTSLYSIETRLGAVYALERLVRSSPGDFKATMEILATAVNSSRFDEEDKGAAFAALRALQRRFDHRMSPRASEEYRVSLKSIPAPDKGEKLSLKFADIVEAELSGFQYREIRLEHVNAISGKFISIKPQDGFAIPAFFHHCNFTGAYFSSSELPGARFVELIGAGIDFFGAKLRRAGFSGKCNLQRATFTTAELHEVEFGDSDLSFADFVGAMLPGAKFGTADVGNAEFSGAHVGGADFSGAKNLTQDQIDSVASAEGVKLPPGILPPPPPTSLEA